MQEKRFKLKKENIKTLIDGLGSCIASDKITVEGLLVGYMYRETPDFESDSGWRFFSGTESQEFADDSNNFMIYDLNTIANYDPEIIPCLSAKIGSEFERKGPTGFRLINN